ncbi:Beta-lactamase OXA-18 [Chlamydiales bacterium STE3]|nr:Beta-lactamase OXA-18 [Chlamydiales bacterium STE3]
MIGKLHFLFVLCLMFWLCICSAEENFIVINAASERVICELGSHVSDRMTPCSTFKIALSLMGYDLSLLKDELCPTLDFQEGYDDYLASWKTPQNPKSWMHSSCIWYSKEIASKLGPETIKSYLTSFDYGNQDISENLLPIEKTNPVWVNGSLKISPKEQARFIQKMVKEELPISKHAIEMTKAILFKEELPRGEKLFGKTGWSGSVKPDSNAFEAGWFVGWVEKDHFFYPFAYLICEPKIALEQRILRVKQLLKESGVVD